MLIQEQLLQFAKRNQVSQGRQWSPTVLRNRSSSIGTCTLAGKSGKTKFIITVRIHNIFLQPQRTGPHTPKVR